MNKLLATVVLSILLFLGLLMFQALIIKIGWSLFTADYLGFSELTIPQSLGLALLVPKGGSYTQNIKK